MSMPLSRSYSEQVASNLLNRYGLAAIWQLHVSAATAYRKGNAMAARSIADVAEAAEREWLRRAAADAGAAFGHGRPGADLHRQSFAEPLGGH